MQKISKKSQEQHSCDFVFFNFRSKQTFKPAPFFILSYPLELQVSRAIFPLPRNLQDFPKKLAMYCAYSLISRILAKKAAAFLKSVTISNKGDQVYFLRKM